MHLTTREEISAPASRVWAALTDFDRFEKMARDNGLPVTRGGTGETPEWTTRATFRGMQRDITLRLVGMDAPETLDMAGESSGVGLVMTAKVAALGPDRSALNVDVTLRGKSLTGKALVQGLKLGHGPIQERFTKRIRRMVKDMGKGIA